MHANRIPGPRRPRTQLVSEPSRLLSRKVEGRYLAVADYGHLAGYRNYLMNGCMRINQRASTSNTDDTFAFDRWNILTETAAVGIGSQSAIENGWTNAMRITQSQASAQRFGVEQIIESANCLWMRGQVFTLSARVRMSVSTTLRYAILEWTGTADAVTSDVVNSWTNGTFTAGQFFNSTTLTVTATGATALTANTPATVQLSTTVGSSLTNVIVLFWTESTQAQNVTLDIGKVQFEAGAAATPFERRPISTEILLCQRYCQALASGSAFARFAMGYLSTTTNSYINVFFPVEFRAVPTLVVSAAGDFRIQSASSLATVSALVLDSASSKVGTLAATCSASTAGQATELLADNTDPAKLTFSAEL